MQLWQIVVTVVAILIVALIVVTVRQFIVGFSARKATRPNLTQENHQE